MGRFQAMESMRKDQLESLITERYPSLPPKLRIAARYVLDAPADVAMQSMRSVAASAGLQPASMLRFARELGFENYETFRAIYIDWLSAHDSTFVNRAESLRSRAGGDGAERLFAEMFDTEVLSLDRTLGAANRDAFAAAQKALSAARRVYILGVRSLFPAAYYLDYAFRLFTDRSVLLTGVGGAAADELRHITPQDALVAFSFAPYASITVDAARFAVERGAQTIAVTDSAVSPIASGAKVVLLAPNASPALIPSILPALAVAQALANLMVTAGGSETLEAIGESEAQLQRFNVYSHR
jgi:DNA-binding MurR/RpiR family transcriptional regulator